MASFSYNQFKSLAFKTISNTSVNPTILYDGVEIPVCGHIAAVSLFVTNSSEDPIEVNVAIRKADDAEDVPIFDKVMVPVGEPFDLLKGSKIFLNREDLLKAWTDVVGADYMSMVMCYALYTPSDLQPLT